MIGSALVKALLDAGYEVAGMDCRRDDRASYRFFETDITDLRAVRQAIQEASPDRIIHLAALAHTTRDNSPTREDYERINVKGAGNVFAAAGELPLLFVSTIDVYGFSRREPVTPETPIRPVSDYARSKAKAEHMCGHLPRHTIFRLCPVYSETMRRDIQKRYYLKPPTVAYRIGRGAAYEVLGLERAVQAMVQWCEETPSNDIRIIRDPEPLWTPDAIRREQKAGRARFVLPVPRSLATASAKAATALLGERPATYLMNKAVAPLRTTQTSRPRSVLYITNNYEPVQKHLLEQMKDQRQVFHIFLYTMRGLENEPFEPDPRIIEYDARWTLGGPPLYLAAMRRIAKQLEKSCKVSMPDVLHGNMCFRDGVICRMLAKRWRIPYVVSVRYTDFILWNKTWARPFQDMFLQVLRDASKVIVMGESYRSKLMEILPEAEREEIGGKCVVIPNGIDDYFLENKQKHKLSGETMLPGEHEGFNDSVLPSKSALRLITIGYLCKRKNQEMSLAAAKELSKRGYNVRLLLVGRVVDPEYQEMIDGEAMIEYRPECPKEDVLLLLRESDVFILPSHKETFGLVYAEAMSQGLPVIYTRGQGFDGQFPEGTVGYAVSDRSASEIADAVERILGRYDEISTNCVECAEEFRWSGITQRLLEVYRKA